MTDSTVAAGDGTQDNEDSQNPGGEAVEQQEEKSEKKDDSGDKKDAEDKDDDKHPAEDDLPEWARKELKRVRKEAAAKRTALKEAQEKLAAAKTPEEFEAATKEFTDKVNVLEYELAKSNVLRTHNIPAEYEDLLDGVPADKLEEKAKKLATLANAQNDKGTDDDLDDLFGGLDPRSSTSGVSSVEELYNLIPR